MSGKSKPPSDDDTPGGFASALDDVRPFDDRDKRMGSASPRLRKPATRKNDTPADAFVHPDADEPRLAHRASVGSRNFDRLARGALATDRKLDLHGMRADAARDALRRSIATSTQAGETVLLIVHGRGKHSGGFAVLRDELPGWLEAEDRVLAFAPAKAGAGSGGGAAGGSGREFDGAGATHVLLRTKRGAR